MAANLVCKFADCGKRVHGRGWCGKHYYRWRVNGDPSLSLKPANGTAQSYFRSVVLNYEGDDCLTWPFYRRPDGYGEIQHKGSMRRVSRRVCEEVYGPTPSPDHEAAHSCGNGHLGCVSKHHLSWKTPVENAADKLIHGTHNRGERQGASKLTEQDVLNIRALKGKLLQREIAEQFGISKSHLNHILHGKAWSWLPGNVP